MGPHFAQPADVPEFFVSGLGRIENMGSFSRHVMVSERRVGGRILYVPRVHIIISNANAHQAILKTARELAVNLVAGDLPLMQH